MKFAVDVGYSDNSALVAGAIFHNWADDECELVTSKVCEISPYESGAFYKREMPCIIKILKDHCLKPDVIVIDGFVFLGAGRMPGLGAHLYEVLGGAIPIIGVAKRPFKETPIEEQLFRGVSKKPIFVSSMGMSLAEAKSNVASMFGEFRIPDLLKRVDLATRG